MEAGKDRKLIIQALSRVSEQLKRMEARDQDFGEIQIEELQEIASEIDDIHRWLKNRSRN